MDRRGPIHLHLYMQPERGSGAEKSTFLYAIGDHWAQTGQQSGNASACLLAGKRVLCPAKFGYRQRQAFRAASHDGLPE